MPHLTVVISYYKAQRNLELILDALARQSFTDFEVIVSEDDYNTATIQFLEHQQHRYPFRIIHNYQAADVGFRKNQMLNRAIKSATTDKMAFLDGDCVPHKHWAAQYVRHIKPNRIAIGRSVMFDETLTKYVYQKGTISAVGWLKILQSRSKKKKEAIFWPWFPLAFDTDKGLVGRNWGILRKHLIEVNGFDEDYVQPAVGEDTDIEWRLLKHGLHRFSMKNKAVTYHLHHPRHYSSASVEQNFALFESKKQLGRIACLNGLTRLNAPAQTDKPFFS